jgi:uncharacterized protein (UPF0332 family)
MKKVKFIKKLIKEKVIRIQESNLNLNKAYNEKSENSLRASKILLKQELLEESTTMSYYSMYHKATALLMLLGIKCENHNATILILKEVLNLDTKDFSDAKDERIDKQYYTDSKTKKQDATNLIKKAELFIEKIDYFVDELTHDSRNKILYNFKKTYFN